MSVSKFDLILEGIHKFMRRGAIGHLTNMMNKLHPADVGTLMALACGFTLTLVAYVWHAHVMLGVVLGAAMFSAITVAAITGALVPVVLKKMNFDPAISSGPFVTTANDITGLVIYLGLATYLLQYLK